MILATLVERQAVVEDNLVALLSRKIAHVLVWIGLRRGATSLAVPDHLLIRPLQKLYCLRKVVNRHVVLFEFHVYQAQIVEVVVWVRLALLLVYYVLVRDFVLARRERAAGVRLQLGAHTVRVLLINPEGVEAVVERVLAGVRPGLQVREQSQMLGNRRLIYLILKADDAVCIEALPLLHRLLDQILSFLHPIDLIASAQIIKGRFVSVEQHLVLKQVDRFRRYCVLSNESSNHNAKAVLGCDRFVEAFVDATGGSP